MNDGKDLTIYINIPYCNSKCHFCVYVAHIKTHDLVKQRALYGDYVEALKTQIREHAPKFKQNNYRIHSIYFGGGTPTSLSTDQLIDILSTLKSCMDFSPHYVDTTLETTPENAVGHDFVRLRKAGFDRISMGVQSMLDDRLKRLGRCHSNLQVTQALENFRNAGFDNVNIDLMVGLPDETSDEIERNLEQAATLGTNHCTVYMYVPAEDTVFKKKLQRYYTAGELLEKYHKAKGIMESHGYHEYQWQYFSKDHTRCICDTTYFGLTTEWFAFGSAGNSLLNKQVIKGPAHHKDFIDRPLKPGQVFAAKNAPEYLELHYNLAISSELGLDLERWEQRLGISLSHAIKLSAHIDASHHYLLENKYLKFEDGRFYFPDVEKKAEYSCLRLAITNDADALLKFNNTYARYRKEVTYE